MLMRAKPQMVSFHFGLPDREVIDAIKDAGIFIISSATTVAEARMLEQRGVDAIIAQGTEAGGHRGTFTGVDISMQPGLFALLPQVVDAVRVPVIAAGGVADGRTVAAAFVLGASAVQLGTAFLRCEEANVLDAHRAALREPTDACTVVTDMITGRPARYMKNRLIEDLMASESEAGGVSRPVQSHRAAWRHGRQGAYRIVCRSIRGTRQRHDCRRVGRVACGSDVRVPARFLAFLALYSFRLPYPLAGAPMSGLGSSPDLCFRVGMSAYAKCGHCLPGLPGGFWMPAAPPEEQPRLSAVDRGPPAEWDRPGVRSPGG